MQRPRWMAGWMGAGALLLAPPGGAGAAFAVREARIVAVASNVAALVQIHSMSMADGVMHMRRLDGPEYRRRGYP